ncbi:MAG TPA: hypothetical protein VHK00_06710 [Miltoncostaeaceae bacterium]|jgi:hypothetical protein|nr:hypothetical protein [Miltoncostaeaceae bacterium]
MGRSGGSEEKRPGREESQEQRIERERREAGDEERDSATGPGYTARPTDAEPEERPRRRDGARPGGDG